MFCHLEFLFSWIFFEKRNLRGSSIFKIGKPNCMFVIYPQYIFSIFSASIKILYFEYLSHYQQIFSFYVLQISLNSQKSEGTIFCDNYVFSVAYRIYRISIYRKFFLTEIVCFYFLVAEDLCIISLSCYISCSGTEWQFYVRILLVSRCFHLDGEDSRVHSLNSEILSNTDHLK